MYSGLRLTYYIMRWMYGSLFRLKHPVVGGRICEWVCFIHFPFLFSLFDTSFRDGGSVRASHPYIRIHYQHTLATLDDVPIQLISPKLVPTFHFMFTFISCVTVFSASTSPLSLSLVLGANRTRWNVAFKTQNFIIDIETTQQLCTLLTNSFRSSVNMSKCVKILRRDQTKQRNIINLTSYKFVTNYGKTSLCFALANEAVRDYQLGSNKMPHKCTLLASTAWIYSAKKRGWSLLKAVRLFKYVTWV